MTVLRKKDEQSAEPCLVVTAEAIKHSVRILSLGSVLSDAQEFTNDSSEAIIVAAGAGSCDDKLRTNKKDETNRGGHVYAW